MKGTFCLATLSPPHQLLCPPEHLQPLSAKLTHLQKFSECGPFSCQRDPAGSATSPTTGPLGTCSKSTLNSEFTPLSFLCPDKQPRPQTFTFKFSHHELHIGSIFPLELQKTSIKLSVESSPRPLTGHEMRRKPPSIAMGRETCLGTETTFSKVFFLTHQSLPTSALLSLGKGSQHWFSPLPLERVT